jgi:hypothetical protein
VATDDDDVRWDAVHRSNFERSAFWDVNWISKARDLFESAKKLEPEVVRVWESYRARAKSFASPLVPDHYQGTYFMLLAFAVENLLKASAVNRNGMEYRDAFRSTLKFPEDLRSHDLVRLAGLVDLSYTPDEEELLRRLTRGATWFGRYPAPLHYAEMSGNKRFSDGNEHSLSWFGGDDVSRLNEFISSLPARLALPQVYWDGQ